MEANDEKAKKIKVFLFICLSFLTFAIENTKTIPTMTNETQLDQLERLVQLIADDNELLNRANTFMQNLVNNKFDYRGKQDLSAELAAKEKMREERHQ